MKKGKCDKCGADVLWLKKLSGDPVALGIKARMVWIISDSLAHHGRVHCAMGYDRHEFNCPEVDCYKYPLACHCDGGLGDSERAACTWEPGYIPSFFDGS